MTIHTFRTNTPRTSAAIWFNSKWRLMPKRIFEISAQKWKRKCYIYKKKKKMFKELLIGICISVSLDLDPAYWFRVRSKRVSSTGPRCLRARFARRINVAKIYTAFYSRILRFNSGWCLSQSRSGALHYNVIENDVTRGYTLLIFRSAHLNRYNGVRFYIYSVLRCTRIIEPIVAAVAVQAFTGPQAKAVKILYT